MVISIDCNYDSDLVDLIKRIPGTIWNREQNRWLAPWSKLQLGTIMQILRSYGDLRIIDRTGTYENNGPGVLPEDGIHPSKNQSRSPEKESGHVKSQNNTHRNDSFYPDESKSTITHNSAAIPDRGSPHTHNKQSDGNQEATRPIPNKFVREINSFTDWLEQKRYSDHTIRAYRKSIEKFAEFHGYKDLSGITNFDIIKFNKEFIIERGFSFSYQNQVINAIKLFYNKVINTHLNLDLDEIERPRKSKSLPNVLSREEVSTILSSLRNTKHRTMLSLIYACGLRRGELLNLIPADIDSKRHIMIIRQGKGRKDRIVPISDKIIEMLRDYYRQYKPIKWLFEGQKPGASYSEQSIQKVMEKAVERSGIRKPVTLHWLRHSYATHLLESGTDLRYIQELLGHSSSKTTEIYTHVTLQSIQNIRSPFDDLH